MILFREKLPEEKEFMLVGDLSELQAKPEEKVNGQEHSGTAENGKFASLLSCLACFQPYIGSDKQIFLRKL